MSKKFCLLHKAVPNVLVDVYSRLPRVVPTVCSSMHAFSAKGVAYIREEIST